MSMKWLKARLSSARAWIWSSTKWGFLALIAAGVIIFSLWKVPEWQVRGYYGRLDAGAISKLTPQELIQLQKDLITAENNARATFAQVLGGLALLFGLYLTYRNVKIAHKNVEVAEEGKLTDRFSKAVELLGSDKLDVRLGGIYALERIGRDSQRDSWTMVEVLTAFVRERAAEMIGKEHYASNVTIGTPPQDIQAAVTVIGRRSWINQESYYQIVDLTDVSLEGMQFLRSDFRKVRFAFSNFRDAFLVEGTFAEADFRAANFQVSLILGTNFSDATFDDANLCGVNLQNAKGLTWKQLSTAIIDEKTKLPPEV
jgi:hypothetical protein